MMTMVASVKTSSLYRIELADESVQLLEQLAGLGQRDEAGRLQDRQADGQVAGVLGQLLLAGLALLFSCSKRGMTTTSSWMMMLAVM